MPVLRDSADFESRCRRVPDETSEKAAPRIVVVQYGVRRVFKDKRYELLCSDSVFFLYVLFQLYVRFLRQVEHRDEAVQTGEGQDQQ